MYAHSGKLISAKQNGYKIIILSGGLKDYIKFIQNVKYQFIVVVTFNTFTTNQNNRTKIFFIQFNNFYRNYFL
jgi:hypothetical protein